MRAFIVPFLLASLTLVGATRSGDDYGSAEWKEEIGRGYLPYRKLVYDDFPITNGVNTPHVMHTTGFIHYSFKSQWSSKGGPVTARVTEMTIRSGLDQNKSWRKSVSLETQALLDHEQGHLDINELCAAELRKAVWPTASGVSGPAALEILRQKIAAIFDARAAATGIEQAKYDEETAHGVRTDKQREWTLALQKRLREANVHYWDDPDGR